MSTAANLTQVTHMLTLLFNWLFRYAEDASFSDCVRAVLPAVLGERGGKGGREKCCVLCCVLCWDTCVLCDVLCCVNARGSLVASHSLLLPST